MILHPGILALLIGSTLSLLMLFYAAIVGLAIYFHWNYESSSAGQLLLERKTYLISTLVKYALGFQIASAILYIYTMDDIHELFVGAMCATGSLNANPIGWYGLFTKIMALFLSGFWLVLNHVDRSVETYPLVKTKYLLLVILTPFIVLDGGLQLSYFLGLNPNIITSCCGSLFGGNTDQSISTISAIPVHPAMAIFFTGFTGYLFLYSLNLRNSSSVYRYAFSAMTFSFFIISIGAIISFVSIYIYELPTHHCPFDILQQEYHFIGYPMYITLFAGTFFGLLPGLFQQTKISAELGYILQKKEQVWMHTSAFLITCFVFLVIYATVSSNLSYI